MGSNDAIMVIAVGAVGAAVAYTMNLGGFKNWLDSLSQGASGSGGFGGGGGLPTGPVTASCDQLCAIPNCTLFKQYCRGTCPKCQQLTPSELCRNKCNAQNMLGGLTSAGTCVCKPQANFPLGRCYNALIGGKLQTCYRNNKCGGGVVGLCFAGVTCPQVTAEWKKRYVCKTTAQAYAYEGILNPTENRMSVA